MVEHSSSSRRLRVWFPELDQNWATTVPRMTSLTKLAKVQKGAFYHRTLWLPRNTLFCLSWSQTFFFVLIKAYSTRRGELNTWKIFKNVYCTCELSDSDDVLVIYTTHQRTHLIFLRISKLLYLRWAGSLGNMINQDMYFDTSFYDACTLSCWCSSDLHLIHGFNIIML